MAIDKEAQKQALLQRAQEDYNRGSGTGGKYYNAEIDFSLWKPGPTQGAPHIIDIIPYRIGRCQPPLIGGKGDKRNGKEGEWDFFFQITVHRHIGPAKQSIICPAKMWAKPCPICEHIERMQADGAEWEEFSNIATMERCLYNVVVMTDAKEQRKGIRIWDTPFKYAQAVFKTLALDARTGEKIMYQSPDAGIGRSIQFEVEKDQYRKVYGHKFLERNYDIAEELQINAHPLDELVELLPYQVIKDIFYGEPDDDQPSAVSRTASRPANQQQEQRQPDPPAAEGARRGLRRGGGADASINPCPKGMRFGEDIDTTPYCENECAEDTYKKCCEAADRIDMEKKQKAEEERIAAEKALAASGGAGTGRRSLRRG